MNARYDDVIVALMKDDWDRAIGLIEQIKAHKVRQMESRLPLDFVLTPAEVNEFAKTTDFLSFHGWEAA